MKKFLKVTVIMALMVTMTIGTAISVSANEVTGMEVEDKSITPRAMGVLSTSWTTVLTSSSGFNRDIRLQATTTPLGSLDTVPCDVRMLGKNGNVLWTGTGVLPGNYAERTFWCGDDVYSVQVRTQSGSGTYWAW